MAYYWNKDGNVMDREIRRKESVAFFANVKYLADKNGLTNKELASVLDIHPTLLWKYIGGNTVPREDTFESIKKHAMDFFDISGTELIDGTFKEVREEVVTAEPVKVEEDRSESSVNTEILAAINKRKERAAQLQEEISTLENALTLIQEEISTLENAITLIEVDKLL